MINDTGYTGDFARIKVLSVLFKAHMKNYAGLKRKTLPLF